MKKLSLEEFQKVLNLTPFIEASHPIMCDVKRYGEWNCSDRVLARIKDNTNTHVYGAVNFDSGNFDVFEAYEIT